MDTPNDEKTVTKDHPKVIALPPLIYLGALSLGMIVHAFYPLSFGEPAGIYAFSGLFFFLVGPVPLVESFQRFLKHGTPPPPNRTPTCIVTDGFYQYSRNPMYVGMTATYLGISLLLGNGWMLVFLLIVLPLMQFGVVLREETYLEEKFGQTYLDYKASVRRWV
jgi:protein-S-isoprenylcysteine O-methyltransferase Ste14